MTHPPPTEPGLRADSLLLALMRSGDRPAAAEFYERYADALRGVATRQARFVTAIDPEDVVQSAFRSFLTGVRRGRYHVPPGGDLWGLLVAVVANKVRSYQRAHLARKRGGGRARSCAEPAADGRAAGWELMTQDVLGRFSPQERELLELRLAGHRVEAIARAVARSKRTVERRLQTCRDRLVTLIQSSESAP